MDKVIIFDTTLRDGEQSAGWNQITWAGDDNRGNRVASGVYFYRVSWERKNETKRMVLLK